MFLIQTGPAGSSNGHMPLVGHWVSRHQPPDLRPANFVSDNETPQTFSVISPKQGTRTGPPWPAWTQNLIHCPNSTLLTHRLFGCLKSFRKHSNSTQEFMANAVILSSCYAALLQLTSLLRGWPTEPSPRRPGQVGAVWTPRPSTHKCSKHKGGSGDTFIPLARFLGNPLKGDKMLDNFKNYNLKQYQKKKKSQPPVLPDSDVTVTPFFSPLIVGFCCMSPSETPDKANQTDQPKLLFDPISISHDLNRFSEAEKHIYTLTQNDPSGHISHGIRICM